MLGSLFSVNRNMLVLILVPAFSIILFHVTKVILSFTVVFYKNFVTDPSFNFVQNANSVFDTKEQMDEGG